MRYTEKLHAHRLKLMLEKENSCGHCPARLEFDFGSPFIYGFSRNAICISDVCIVCKEFVGIQDEPDCPCDILGKKAISASWKALEEKGYL